MPQTNSELVEATKELNQHVVDLSGRLSAKELLAKRTRMLTRIAIVIAVISVIGGCISGFAIYKNAKNAEITCMNANQTREAQAAIWGFVYAANENDPDVTKDEQDMVDRLRAYTDKVFAQRDCKDLGKHYELPPPPIPQEKLD